MLIIKEPTLNNNVNLVAGNTYLITAVTMGSPKDNEYYLGRVFTHANVAGTHAIVWLSDAERGGGWDSVNVLAKYGISYSEVNLTLIK